MGLPVIHERAARIDIGSRFHVVAMLQAVRGFDNLLYISMESERVEERDRQRVRHLGICIAIALRIVPLLVVTKATSYFQDSFLEIDTTPLRTAGVI